MSVLRRAVLADPGGGGADVTGPHLDRTAEAAADRARAFHRFYLRLRIDDQLAFLPATGAPSTPPRTGRPSPCGPRCCSGPPRRASSRSRRPGTARAAWAVAGALLAALAAAVTAFETLVGFPQLEKVYGDAARNLEEAQGRLGGRRPGTRCRRPRSTASRTSSAASGGSGGSWWSSRQRRLHLRPRP